VSYEKVQAGIWLLSFLSQFLLVCCSRSWSQHQLLSCFHHSQPTPVGNHAGVPLAQVDLEPLASPQGAHITYYYIHIAYIYIYIHDAVVVQSSILGDLPSPEGPCCRAVLFGWGRHSCARAGLAGAHEGCGMCQGTKLGSACPSCFWELAAEIASLPQCGLSGGNIEG